MKTVLSIAGSDSSGGAGIQADIKTMCAHGVFGMTAITAITAQNTLGVTAIQDVSPEVIEAQLDAVFTDIFPDAVKIGMVSSAETIRIIANALKNYNAKNIVLDPVMVATSGARLISEDAIQALKTELIPLADVITPNVYEAEILSGEKITDSKMLSDVALKINRELGVNVLVKGGHLAEKNDILAMDGNTFCFTCDRAIDNPNTHGTGCTLSSAIASNLAKGMKLEEAILHAKKYITDAIAYGLDLGQGSGPLNHMVQVEDVVKYNVKTKVEIKKQK